MKIHIDSGLVFDVPESLDAITVDQIYDFYVSEEKLNQDQAEVHLFEALSYIFGENVSELPIGQLSDVFKIGNDLTAYGLYNYIVQMVNTYNPALRKDYSVDVEGSTYYISGHTKEIAMSQRTLTVGEVITANTFIHYASKREAKSFDNIDFNLTLEQIAVLLRKEGEQLPVKVAERTDFINSRKVIFAKLPYSEVLNILFFLLNTRVGLDAN